MAEINAGSAIAALLSGLMESGGRSMLYNKQMRVEDAQRRIAAQESGDRQFGQQKSIEELIHNYKQGDEEDTRLFRASERERKRALIEARTDLDQWQKQDMILALDEIETPKTQLFVKPSGYKGDLPKGYFGVPDDPPIPKTPKTQNELDIEQTEIIKAKLEPLVGKDPVTGGIVALPGNEYAVGELIKQLMAVGTSIPPNPEEEAYVKWLGGVKDSPEKRALYAKDQTAKLVEQPKNSVIPFLLKVLGLDTIGEDLLPFSLQPEKMSQYLEARYPLSAEEKTDYQQWLAKFENSPDTPNNRRQYLDAQKTK